MIPVNPFTAAAAVGLDIGSAFLGNRLAISRQHDAQDFSAQQYERRYQTQVRDLIAAGLNPMLAYGTGPGSSPSGSALSATGPNAGGTYLNARLYSAQIANINADTQNKETMTEQIVQQTEVLKTTAEQNKIQTEKIAAEIYNVKQELDNLRAQWMRDTSDQKLKDAMQSSEQFLQRLYEQQEQLLKNQVMITNPQAQAAATTGAFAAHGENISKGIKPITDLLPWSGRRSFPEQPEQKYPRKVKPN